MTVAEDYMPSESLEDVLRAAEGYPRDLLQIGLIIDPSALNLPSRMRTDNLSINLRV